MLGCKLEPYYLCVFEWALKARVFVPGTHCLRFASTQVKHLSGAPQAAGLSHKDWTRQENLSGTSTLAYWAHA
jgi:hypothetical protein